MEKKDKPNPEPKKSSEGALKKIKLGKDPSIDTSFLRDEAREQQLEQERKLREAAWKELQEKIKRKF